MSNPVFIERTFSGYPGQIAEVQVIGPFDNRKIAKQYNERTERHARPKTMYDHCLSTRITTKPKTSSSNCVLRTMKPDFYLLMEIEEG